MCNPRRVEVTVTRLISEAWEREVSRTIEMSETVETTVRQRLDQTIAAAAVQALEAALAQPELGWVPTESGFRYDLPGGAIYYHVDTRELEIVARESDVVRAEGHASDVVGGTVSSRIRATGRGSYDTYFGQTAEQARQQAQQEGERDLDRREAEARERLRRDSGAEAERAARDAAARLEAAAQADAQRRLRRQMDDESRRQQDAARRNLAEVGRLGQAAFHRVLQRAYRDAILSWARLNRAEGVRATQVGDVTEIEFMVSR